MPRASDGHGEAPRTGGGPAPHAAARIARLVGLDEVREVVGERLANPALRRLPADGAETVGAANLVFSGRRGTGRQAVARLYARALGEIGLLTGGALHEMTLSAFPARWPGQAEFFAAGVLEEARDGMLLLEADDAFGYWPQQMRSRVIAAISAVVGEARRPVPPIVLSGEPRQLAAVLEASPAFAGLFSTHVTFPDYSAADLTELARRHLVARGFEVGERALDALADCFEAAAPETTAWDAHQFAAYISDTARSLALDPADVYGTDDEPDDDGFSGTVPVGEGPGGDGYGGEEEPAYGGYVGFPDGGLGSGPAPDEPLPARDVSLDTPNLVNS
jgi:hypothetical protein